MKAKLSGLIVCVVIVLAGCETVPKKPEAKLVLSAQVNEAIAIFKQKDPQIDAFLSSHTATQCCQRCSKGLSGWAAHTAEDRFMSRAQ